jgi:hypothetical protein
MCNKCITYLRVSFLNLIQIPHTKKLITLGDSEQCKLLLAKFYLGICSSIQLYQLGGKFKILKDKSFYNNEDYTWVTDKITTDEFIAHSLLSTGEKINVTLRYGIPTAVNYIYFTDIVRFHLNKLQLHGEYMVQQGNTHLKGFYDNGLKTGIWTYRSNSYTNTCCYHVGDKHGISITHYQGQKIEETWCNGKLCGSRKIYQGDKIIKEQMYHDDKLVTSKT